MTDWTGRARNWVREMEALTARVGPRQSEQDIERQSLAMWRNEGTKNLASHSHDMSVDGSAGIDGQTWVRIGRDAWDRFGDAMAALRWPWQLGSVLDYGCGYGAQASAFAQCGVDEIIAVDVQADALAACNVNVASVVDLDEAFTFRPVLIDKPEDVHQQVAPSTVDAFVSFYVFELLPGQAYGERVLRMAYEVLKPGGIGFVQFKYPTGRWDGPLRRRYNTRTAPSATTYTVPEFWSMVERVGFAPGHVTIEERNELDSHYAYMSFTKPA